MVSFIYNNFFTQALNSKQIVVVTTNVGSLSGLVSEVFTDGITLLTNNNMLFAIGYDAIIYAGLG